MAPKPPIARRAPAKPWRASMTVGDGGPEMAPKPPIARRAPAKPWRASMTVGDGGPEMAPKPPIARRAAAEPWRASITVAGYHRRCYAPVARRRAGRSRRASLPRDHRDPQGLEGEVRARQAHGPALARSRAALGRALSGELRLPAADLLRGR